MNKIKQEVQLFKEYQLVELLKSAITGFIFFIFPTLLLVGLLITFGTLYPYWNKIFLIGGSIVVFLYGFWTSTVMIETLNTYHSITVKDIIYTYFAIQLLSAIMIVIVNIIIINQIF